MRARPQFQHKTGRPQACAVAWRGAVSVAGYEDLSVCGSAALTRLRIEAGRFAHEAHFALLRLPVRGGHHPVRGGRGRGRRPALAFFQGPAGLFAVAGLRAAGDDARARGRRLAGRRICPRAPALHPDPGGAEAGDQRLPRRRGQELLRAWRARFHRHRARGGQLCAELRLQPPPARRFDHHATSRQELPVDRTRFPSRARSRRRCWRSRSSAPTPRTRSSSFT